LNDVILSNAKNLAFLCWYEVLHSVQDDHYNCRVIGVSLRDQLDEKIVIEQWHNSGVLE